MEIDPKLHFDMKHDQLYFDFDLDSKMTESICVKNTSITDEVEIYWFKSISDKLSMITKQDYHFCLYLYFCKNLGILNV